MPAPGPDKALCGAQRLNAPKGTTCKRVAGHATDHLGTGRCSRHGGSTQTHVAAAEVELRKQAVARYGLPVDIDPATAMLQAVAHSYGQVLFMRSEVAGLDKPWQEGEDGAKPHVAWVMLKAEEKHHAAVCRDAEHAGVQRRTIELMEESARQMLSFATHFAKFMGWDPAAAEVKSAARRSFELLEGEG